jgi:cytochrome c biogenesis protein CcmG, thiol:disulfide interchange protein DsbE
MPPGRYSEAPTPSSFTFSNNPISLNPVERMSPMKIKIYITLLSILALTTGIVLAEQKKLWAKSILNQKAPELIVEKWLTKEPDRKGKFVLIDFWATWCGPCRKAIPELNAFQKKFGDKLVVIGISDEAEEKVRAFANPKIEYNSAIDTKARTKKALEVKGIPHVIIIDPSGIVRWEGFPFLKDEELSEKVVADIITKYSK